MICPNENIEMRSITIESHYGQPVKLDQCPECGGIWFDTSELYIAKRGQAAKIEFVDADILRAPTMIEKSELICPRDLAKLIRFNDLYFPKEIIILRCPICNGLWLNRGEFSKYQNFRQAKWQKRETSPEDLKLKQDVEQMLAQRESGDAADSLGKLGKFLSTPLDPNTWSPQNPSQLSDKEKTSLDLILNIVSILLRFFIRI